MKSWNNNINWTIAGIMLVMTLISSNLYWSQVDGWKNVLESDAKGYYAYLPAVVVYQDLNFNFIEKTENGKNPNGDLFFDFREDIEGKNVNKFFAGSAVAQLPFYVLAYAISEPLGFDSNGYSKPCILSVTIGGLFYLLIGLIFLSRLMKLYEINGWNNAIVLIAFTLGSNLFCYSIIDSGLSHIYSFAFIAMFLYYGKRFFQINAVKYIYLMAVMMGVIVLTRPVNGIILFILPFLAGNKQDFLAGIKYSLKFKLSLILSIILGLLIISIQLIIYKIATGSYFVFSYNEEGFNFLTPHMFDILFSYKKGLFLYTPIYLLSLAGLYFLWKKNKFEAYCISLFLIVLVYILSSWWNWWYGGSFSSRVFVEYIPIFALLLGITLTNLKTNLTRMSFLSLLGILVLVCQIQTYQYRYYIIDYENMTKEKYWDVFLRIDKLI